MISHVVNVVYPKEIITIEKTDPYSSEFVIANMHVTQNAYNYEKDGEAWKKAAAYYFAREDYALFFAERLAAHVPGAQVFCSTVTHLMATSRPEVVKSKVTEKGILPL